MILSSVTVPREGSSITSIAGQSIVFEIAFTALDLEPRIELWTCIALPGFLRGRVLRAIYEKSWCISILRPAKLMIGMKEGVICATSQ